MDPRPLIPTGTESAHDDESGSVIVEYGLLAIVGATVATLVIKWATGGAIWELFGAVARKIRGLLGA